MLKRRSFLAACAAAPLSLVMADRSAFALQAKSMADPLRVGVESALVISGLARALQSAFGRDTGIAVTWVPLPAQKLLEAVERGEVDVALCNAAEAEAALERQTLVHDRRIVARSDFVIVGPAKRGKSGDPARLSGLRDAALALQRLRDAALATPGTVSFLSANDGSAAFLVEQALWRTAKVAPAAPWYGVAAPGDTWIAQARARGAYAVVERGAWGAQGGGPLAVLVEADPALAEAVHVMRSFRVNHPAGKIFVAWVGGGKGHRVAASVRGYRAP